MVGKNTLVSTVRLVGIAFGNETTTDGVGLVLSIFWYVKSLEAFAIIAFSDIRIERPGYRALGPNC